MDICKNAVEYENALNRLWAEFSREIAPKERAIRTRYRDLIENATDENVKEVFKKEEDEINILYHDGMKPIHDFIENQPEKPIYVFKTNGKYYELKKDWIKAEWTKSKNPITRFRLLLLLRQKPGWVRKSEFPNSTFDFIMCPNCGRKFTRYYPHEKYCFMCQRSPRSKKPITGQSPLRYCQNPGCDKPIPAGKNRGTKYCCNACKTAAYEKRKL